MKIYGILGCAVILLGIISCSKDDNYHEPDGAITLNMLNEDNGKTLLGESDVYIDNANNFFGPTCYIAHLGSKKGLGEVSEPQLSALAEKVAVLPGNAYQVFRRRALLEFPSGNSALAIAGDYYNVYVGSEITQQGDIIGATVKYALADVPDYGLPEFEENAVTLSEDKTEAAIELSTDDFEYFLEYQFDRVECRVEGKKLIFNLVNLENYYPEYFKIYIRIKGSYTAVIGRIKY